MKTILFVCVHNSGRSQMAAAYLESLARGRAKALSAGTQPGEKVNPVVVKAMAEEGIDIIWSRSNRLDATGLIVHQV